MLSAGRTCSAARVSERHSRTMLCMPAHAAAASTPSSSKASSWVVPRAEVRRPLVLASAALAAAPPAAAASHQAAASSSSGGSSITFKIHYSTTFGEVIKLVGNFEQAGNWDVDKAAELKWTQGDTWTTTLSLPAGNKYEYKFVVFNTKNRTKRWEDGPNRTIESTKSEMVLDMEWSSQAVSVASADTPAPASREELAARARERDHGSDMIFSAFTRMVSQARPGTIWSTSEADDLHAAVAVEAEFAAVVANLSSSKAAAGAASKAAPRLAKAKGF